MTREIKLFITVMVAFTTGMAVLLFYDVGAWWIWYLYFAIWTLIELKIAKHIKLKWWWWVIIIALILLIDFLILTIT